jgi:hypothetical protein
MGCYMEQQVGAVKKVRAVFTNANKPLTLREIQDIDTTLKVTAISMALCYLHKQRYVTRESIPAKSLGRKLVYLYTYSDVKLPKQ